MTQTEMHGKICLVTGSTRGLGKATAFTLARQPESVAERAVYYAASPDVQEMTGMVFHQGRDARPCTTDQAVAQHLWETSLAVSPLDEVTPRERIHGEKRGRAEQKVLPLEDRGSP